MTDPTSGDTNAGHDGRYSNRLRAATRRQQGFTVVELVVVMVVLGIVAASFMPRFFAASKFEEMGFADAAAGAVRYAQKLAVFTGCPTRVEIDAGGYALWQRATDCQTGAFTRPVQRPGGQQWAQNAPNGVAVGSLDVYFDGLGRPFDHATAVPLSAPSGASFTVGSSADDGYRTISIAGETGFVGAPWATPPSG